MIPLFQYKSKFKFIISRNPSIDLAPQNKPVLPWHASLAPRLKLLAEPSIRNALTNDFRPSYNSQSRSMKYGK